MPTGIEKTLKKIVRVCMYTAACSFAGFVVVTLITTVGMHQSYARITPDNPMTESSSYNTGLDVAMGEGLEIGYGNIAIDSTPLDVVYYNQTDPQYANQPYGTDKIGTHGCGPTAMAIVISTLTDNLIDPIEMSEWAYKSGYWYKDKGSLHALIPDAATAWGLEVSGCGKTEGEKLHAALTQKKLVVALMSKGHFTTSGHFIVLCGLDENGRVLVADPASRERSAQSWDLDLILNEASSNASSGGPFWIIG